MINSDQFFKDNRFQALSVENQQAILKLDKMLSDKGYVLAGNWRNDTSSDGCNSTFEVVNPPEDRKNLVTLRPMKSFLKVEVYWGYSREIKDTKKPKVNYNIGFNEDIPNELMDEIDELYNHFFLKKQVQPAAQENKQESPLSRYFSKLVFKLMGK